MSESEKRRPSTSQRARALEAADLEKGAELHARAEETKRAVLEAAGALLDAARADPDFEVHEEKSSVQHIADLTGRGSGERPAIAKTEPSPPMSPEPEGPITRRPTDLDTAARIEQVLVVEDNADIADLLAQMLSDEGYRVRIARHGVEALQKILVDQPGPDVVILDMGLPYLSGEGVRAALLTTDKADLPIVVITAGTLDTIPVAMRKECICIQKSTQMTEVLKAHVREVVAQRVAEWRARLR